MRRRLVLPCGLIVFAISMFAFAQVPEAEIRPPQPGRTSGAILFEENAREAPAEEQVAEDVSETEETSTGDEQVLREQYLKLVQEKVELMDRNVLREEISRLERGIEELKANAKLARMRAELQALIQQHPNTHAAGIAQRMLQAAEQTGFAPFGAPSYESPIQPTPDSRTYFQDNVRPSLPFVAPTPDEPGEKFEPSRPPQSRSNR